MNATELVLELRRLSDEVAAMRAELRQALNPSVLRPAEAACVDWLGRIFGSGATVTTREIVQAARQDFGDRPQLRAALEAVAAGLRSHAIGIALGNIVERGGAGSEWQLSRANSEGGSRVWVLRGTKGDPVPRSPSPSLAPEPSVSDAQSITSERSQ